MEQSVIKIEAKREGYSINQVSNTMTVGELIAYLEQFDENDKVYLSHDNGYTYGGISESDIDEDWINDDEE